LADQVAAAGYIAVAPDLLSGMGPNGGRSSAFAGQSEVTEAVGKLNPDPDHGRSERRCGHRAEIPVGKWQAVCLRLLLGWRTEFSFRDECGDLSAAFVFYGPPPATDAMARIKAPIYGFSPGWTIVLER